MVTFVELWGEQFCHIGSESFGGSAHFLNVDISIRDIDD